MKMGKILSFLTGANIAPEPRKYSVECIQSADNVRKEIIEL
jgi:hypothetical protein